MERSYQVYNILKKKPDFFSLFNVYFCVVLQSDNRNIYEGV